VPLCLHLFALLQSQPVDIAYTASTKATPGSLGKRKAAVESDPPSSTPKRARTGYTPPTQSDLSFETKAYIVGALESGLNARDLAKHMNMSSPSVLQTFISCKEWAAENAPKTKKY